MGESRAARRPQAERPPPARWAVDAWGRAAKQHYAGRDWLAGRGALVPGFRSGCLLSHPWLCIYHVTQGRWPATRHLIMLAVT